MRNHLQLTISVDPTAAAEQQQPQEQEQQELPAAIRDQRHLTTTCLTLFQETLENGGTCFEFGQESKGLPVSSPIAKSVSFHSGTSLPEERKISSGLY
jgi:hypothetical protein